MRDCDLPTLTHHWKVTFTAPVPSGNPSFPDHEYSLTQMVDVLAGTIDEAIAKVREMFPRATIYTVSHHGKIRIDARKP